MGIDGANADVQLDRDLLVVASVRGKGGDAPLHLGELLGPADALEQSSASLRFHTGHADLWGR